MKIFGYTHRGGPDVASLLDVDEPTPAPGEVLIEMHATSVNPGDLATRRGANEMPVTYPMAMGREAAGRVLATGEDVEGINIDDLVFGSSATGHGAFGERALLDGAATAHIPAGLDTMHAACIPVAFGTALDVLDHFGLQRGDDFVVVGAGGGVGLAITSIARSRGVRIIGVASAAKKDLVTTAGGEHVESGSGWVDRVRAVLEKNAERGAAPAALFDLVGGDTLDEASALASGKALISVADPAKAGEHGGSGIARRRDRETYSQVADLLARGEAEVVVSQVFPLDQAAEAVAVVEHGHAEGKIVITQNA